MPRVWLPTRTRPGSVSRVRSWRSRRPQTPWLFSRRAVLRGACFATLKQWANAAAEYRAALAAQAPPDVDLLNALAFAELQQGHASESRALLGRSLALRPDQPEIERLQRSIEARP